MLGIVSTVLIVALCRGSEMFLALLGCGLLIWLTS
jgi:hypothetical protein